MSQSTQGTQDSSWWDGVQSFVLGNVQAKEDIAQAISDFGSFLYRNPAVLVLGLISAASLFLAIQSTLPSTHPVSLFKDPTDTAACCFGTVAAISFVASIVLGIYRKETETTPSSPSGQNTL